MTAFQDIAKQNANLASDLQKLTEKVNAIHLKENDDSLQETMKTLSTQNESHQQTVKSIKDEVEALRKELDELKTSKKEIETLQTQLNDLKANQKPDTIDVQLMAISKFLSAPGSFKICKDHNNTMVVKNTNEANIDVLIVSMDKFMSEGNPYVPIKETSSFVTLKLNETTHSEVKNEKQIVIIRDSFDHRCSIFFVNPCELHWQGFTDQRRYGSWTVGLEGNSNLVWNGTGGYSVRYSNYGYCFSLQKDGHVCQYKNGSFKWGTGQYH